MPAGAHSGSTGSADRGRTWLAVAALLVCGALAHANGLGGPFLFDDLHSIVESPNVRALWPPTLSLTGPAGSGASGRPLVALSLSLNHALGGLAPRGYHVFNVGVHLLAALALFGLVRRVLLASGRADTALPVAFASALLWVLHPLHTDAIQHVVYRGETMMALFYLLALYGVARACGGEGSARWSAVALLAAAASMASKEVAISLPLAALALDRTFFAGSFRAALRRRWKLHAGLAASWLVLAASMLSGDRGESVGLGHEQLGALDYLRTQAGAVARYLRLSFWPRPLAFDYYGWPVARAWGAVLPQALLLGALLAASALLFARRRAAGFLGLAFFAVLAPSSSVVPLAGELVAEHRMVLPLAAVVVLAVLLARRALARVPVPHLGAALLAAAALGLGLATRARNADYASAATIWADTVAKRPDNARAWNSLGVALKAEGRVDEAAQAYRRCLALEPGHARANHNLGNVLAERGRFAEALPLYERAAQGEPDDAKVRFSLAQALAWLGRGAEAAREAQRAARRDPGIEPACVALASALASKPGAEAAQRAAAVELARGLAARGNVPAALAQDRLARALAGTGRFGEAAAAQERALAAARGGDGSVPLAALQARLAAYRAGQLPTGGDA